MTHQQGQSQGGRQEREYDHLFKLLIIGDSGSGKSALLFRFADNIFSHNYVTTVGVDFRIRTLNINGERIKLQVWDTAGQERFRTITSTYYRGTHGVIIVYDVMNGDSYTNVKKWLYEIDTNCDSVAKILVGTKNDDPARKIVQTEDAMHLSRTLAIPFIETSAKDNHNVEEMFMMITQMVLKNKKKHLYEEARKDMIHLRPMGGFGVGVNGGPGGGGNKKKKSSCC